MIKPVTPNMLETNATKFWNDCSDCFGSIPCQK